jgi:flagellar hook protein FlgE
VLRSLFSGITGLRQHQTMMDVVSNNISNVNTAGFKSSGVVFEDTLSQMVRASGGPVDDRGGVNPAQVGLGVQLGGISTNFGQGSQQTTNRSTDLMIDGDGFFVMKDGGNELYTRAGAFSFDTDGRLTNESGMIVQGWLGVNGTVNTNGSLQNIVVPAGSIAPPIASTFVTVGGNITSPGTAGEVFTLGATVYDGNGLAHDLTIQLTRTSDTDFTVDLLDEDGNATGTSGSISFNSDGSVASSTDPTWDVPSTTPASVVTVGISGLTQYGGQKTLSVTDKDGAASGTLQSIQIGPDGTVVGKFSNGSRLDLAVMALANFNNPNGLEKVGGSMYDTTSNSGLPQIGRPSTGGRGQLVAGALEMSNVDLAQEFTNLIIAQRGFQANSRVITSSDEMLQDLVNIKR